MATGSSLVSLLSACLFVASSLQSTLPASPLLGVSPQDEMYYMASTVIACKDRSKSFSRDRLNDGFCDCADGTDEPDCFGARAGYCARCANASKCFQWGHTKCGTSACPYARFYCRNVGSKSQFLFSSRVNDGICDCRDGSDEYDGRINCPNTCNGNGYVVKKNIDNLTGANPESISSQEKTFHSNLQDLILKLKELKTLLMLEVVFLGCVIAYGLFCRQVRTRRRRRQ